MPRTNRPGPTLDAELLAYCNGYPAPLLRSAVYFLLARIRLRDPAWFATIRGVLDQAREGGGADGTSKKFLVHMAHRRRLPPSRFDESAAGLACDYAWVSMWLAQTDRTRWADTVDACLEGLQKQRTLSPSRRKALVVALERAKVAPEAAKHILLAAGWGKTLASITARLSHLGSSSEPRPPAS